MGFLLFSAGGWAVDYSSDIMTSRLSTIHMYYCFQLKIYSKKFITIFLAFRIIRLVDSSWVKLVSFTGFVPIYDFMILPP